ncbi:MAG TPA: hypothetical protein VF491_17760 [Vicinamibacterales bacterium]
MTEQVESSQIQRVTVIDVNMPFGSMVAFMIKWALAAIPAFLILAFVGFFLSAALAGVLSGLTRVGRTATTLNDEGKRMAYTSDLANWRERCGALDNQLHVADSDQARYQACVSDKVSLRLRAAAIGADEP